MSSLSHEPGYRRVVIVGGGLAGLSAAEALSRMAGDRLDITILEWKRITGGRAGSFIDAVSGERTDYCQHVAMGCCTNLLGLLERCGLMEFVHRYPQLQFLHPDHPHSRFRPSQWLPAPLHLVRAVGSLRYLTSAQKRQLRCGLWRLMRASPSELANQTAVEWLSQNGQHAETIASFWDVILVSALGEHAEHVSMASARKVLIDGFAAARGASDIWVPTCPLSELFGKRLSEAVASGGVTIQCDCAVRRIDGDDSAVATIETTRCGVLPADHVIVAVPWYRIERLFRGTRAGSKLPNLDRYGRFPSSPISGLHLWLDRQITDEPHVVMVGTTAQWLFRQPFRDTDSGFYYQVVISSSRQATSLPRQQLVETIMQELRVAFPAARDANLIHSRIVTDPQAVFSVRPEVESARPSSSTPLPWLHLAGDWIATGWPSTMEGAVISGRMAASSVIEREGLGMVPIDAGLPRGWLARLLIRS